MRRITISVDDDLADAFEALVRRKGYMNRSETSRPCKRGPTRANWAACLMPPTCLGQAIS